MAGLPPGSTPAKPNMWQALGDGVAKWGYAHWSYIATAVIFAGLGGHFLKFL